LTRGHLELAISNPDINNPESNDNFLQENKSSSGVSQAEQLLSKAKQLRDSISKLEDELSVKGSNKHLLQL